MQKADALFVERFMTTLSWVDRDSTTRRSALEVVSVGSPGSRREPLSTPDSETQNSTGLDVQDEPRLRSGSSTDGRTERANSAPLADSKTPNFNSIDCPQQASVSERELREAEDSEDDDNVISMPKAPDATPEPTPEPMK